MEFSNEGESLFHRYQAAFLLDQQGNLLCCNGPNRARVQQHWASIKQCLPGTVTNQAQLECIDLGEDFPNQKLYWRHHSSNGTAPGIILSKPIQDTTAEKSFEGFFIQLILDQVDFAISHPNPSQAASRSWRLATEQIVSLFDIHLRYQGKEDKWIDSGRAYFSDRVDHFTSQGAKIELCLPAFPCKSSNTNKVAGKDPDRGERLALERLHGFVEAIEEIYEPGAKLWIISDGHVFSDCIGADDEDVDRYGRKLTEMNHAIGLQRGSSDRVGFKSLVDLFELDRSRSQFGPSELARQLDIPTIDHHVDTRLTGEAELCRRILMAGCQPQTSAVRARISSQDAAILALYRGFSRFMLEDLELHPFTKRMSRSKQKKLSAKVAFEMILRNQAYSNLVELLFPNHVRLSIHAHNNAGPKFGIQLFDPAAIRAVESLGPNGEPMSSRDLLHIPTPWHNCVVEVVGSDVMYVTKSKVARDALAAGGMTGGLVVQGDRSNPIGSSFILQYLGGTDEEKRVPEEKQAEVPEPPKSTVSRVGSVPLSTPLVVKDAPRRYRSAPNWLARIAGFPATLWQMMLSFWHKRRITFS
ncbi:pyoverdine/dityrosine biosynthesis protein [Xylariaceae sp. FL0662B]|nr:pyoverdine/dityrosine biosynthesis protein [Xylariaceae sp. FL0662B]